MTVNNMMGAVMAFVRYCHRHGWIQSIPDVEKLEVDDVMKARPVTGEEFDRMIEVTPSVVGDAAADSWIFALRILWESGFRVGDLVDFSWDDERRIHSVWTKNAEQHSTIVIPSTQKNGRLQEVPMLPGLVELLSAVPKSKRCGWVTNPKPVEYEITVKQTWFQPTEKDLKSLAAEFSNCSIATACGVSETTVRKWLNKARIQRDKNSSDTPVQSHRNRSLQFAIERNLVKTDLPDARPEG